MPSIVQVNVSQVVAPTPNLLQKKGALISQGATNTSTEAVGFCVNGHVRGRLVHCYRPFSR